MNYQNPYSDSPNFIYLGRHSTDAFNDICDSSGKYDTVDFYMLYDRSESIRSISFGMRHSDEENDYWSGHLDNLHQNLENSPWKQEMLTRFYHYLDTKLILEG